MGRCLRGVDEPVTTITAAMRAALALFVFYAALTCGFDTSEGRDDVVLARHLVETGSLAMKAPLNTNWVRGIDGQYYSSHEAMNALVLVPIVLIADPPARTIAAATTIPAEWLTGAVFPLMSAIYVAFTAAAFFICFNALSVFRTRDVLVMTFALGVTTILAPYSRILFEGVLGGALIAWALATGTLAASRASSGFAFASGLLAGAAFATRQPLVLLAAAIAGHFALDVPRDQRLRLLAWFVAGALPALVWQGWYNAIRTGSPIVPAVTMPQFQRNNGAGNLPEGVLGMLFSPGKSLFLFSPLLVFAPFGWRYLHRRAPGFSWGLLAGVIAYLLLHAQIRNWSGEWGWGPRYTVPLTMPLMIPAAFAIQALRPGSIGRRAALTIGVIGLCVQIVGITANWHYRSTWLIQNGLYDRDAAEWSLVRGQFVDVTRFFATNVARVAGAGVDPTVVAEASGPTIASGNGLNVWPTVALAAGVPAWIVVTTAVAALASTMAAFRFAWPRSS